jgi:hypothetical protein
VQHINKFNTHGYLCLVQTVHYQCVRSHIIYRAHRPHPCLYIKTPTSECLLHNNNAQTTELLTVRRKIQVKSNDIKLTDVYHFFIRLCQNFFQSEFLVFYYPSMTLQPVINKTNWAKVPNSQKQIHIFNFSLSRTALNYAASM